jgi:HPt (histidine-containing phosphotransfer) domain-containing protein
MASWVLPEELRQLAESDEALVKEVLAVFQSDTAERIARLRASLDRGDTAGVKTEAHALKGSSGQVGAGGVSAICRQIELHMAGPETAVVKDLVAQLEASFEAVCRDMSS